VFFLFLEDIYPAAGQKFSLPQSTRVFYCCCSLGSTCMCVCVCVCVRSNIMYNMYVYIYIHE
jgi:hypothetical protein